mmetsp:Transcript_25938/g.43257  ORF Transcript_25938/g.43257 Transcript_25938/m.43257 type:complete len:99 (+) Transcript_25938:220-516(+)
MQRQAMDQHFEALGFVTVGRQLLVIPWAFCAIHYGRLCERTFSNGNRSEGNRHGSRPHRQSIDTTSTGSDQRQYVCRFTGPSPGSSITQQQQQQHQPQ